MSEQNLLYATLLLIAALSTTVIAAIVWQRRENPSARVLLWLTIAMVWWDMTYAFHWMGLTQPQNFFWLDATYAGVVMVPTLFLIFILNFTNQGHWLKHRLVWLLLLEPLITLIALWTDPYHDLFFGGLRQADAGAILNGGPFYWINIIYSFSLVFIGYLVLLLKFRKETALYRLQAGTILVGATIPWIFVTIGVAGISPFKNLDLTPFGFTFTSIAFTIGLLRYRLLDIIPLARDLLVENLRDGIMVLDLSNRVVDINPSLAKILRLTYDQLIGKPIEKVCGSMPVLNEICIQESTGTFETHITNHNTITYYEINSSTIQDKRASFIGRLIEIRNITDLKTTELKLREANKQLTRQVAEIEELRQQMEEMAIHDSLTGLFNRRTLADFLEREIAQAQRSSRPLVVVLMDIDHFKNINDDFGHQAGDRVLIELGQLILQKTRQGDFACRFGGEEFVIVIPEIEIPDALRRIDQLREEVNGRIFLFNQQSMQITLSAGIAVYPKNGETIDALLFASDQALYMAKNSGRNRVVLHKEILPD
jgi:diguanylate cyclase (GGDEF)-like protein/PAS domain S-box-containing protein